MKPSAYWKKATKAPGENLVDYKAELDRLTVEDKADLDRWAEDEMKVLGIAVD